MLDFYAEVIPYQPLHQSQGFWYTLNSTYYQRRKKTFSKVEGHTLTNY